MDGGGQAIGTTVQLGGACMDKLRKMVYDSRKGRIKMDDRYFQIVDRCLLDWDVMQLFPGAPQDEYEAEAYAIAARLPGCRCESDVQQCLYEVFAAAFGELAPERDACKETAERIWAEIKA